MVAPIGVVSNIFLVALSAGILYVACISLALSWAGPLALLANQTNYLLALSSVSVAGFFAAVPGGHFFVNPRPWRLGETARVCVLDLPRGGAAHSWLEPDCAWMLDCGSPVSWASICQPHLRYGCVTALDGALLSHWDAAHTGGAAAMRKAFSPELVLAGPKESPKTRAVETDQTIHTGFRQRLSPRTELEALYPPASAPPGLADDRCSVVLVTHEGFRILFCSDAGFLAEKWLLENAPWLRADVVVKGRCEGDFSGLEEFYRMTRPRLVIASHAERPATERIPEEWPAMLARLDIPLADQLEHGAVEMFFQDGGLTARGFLTGQEWRLAPEPRQ